MKTILIAVFVLLAASTQAQTDQKIDSLVIEKDLAKLTDDCECTATRAASFIEESPCFIVPAEYIKRVTKSKTTNIFDIRDEATPDQIFSAAKLYCREEHKRLVRKMADVGKKK